MPRSQQFKQRGPRRAGLSARRRGRRADACDSAVGATSSEVARSRNWREVGLGAQILKDLGISSIRLLTSRKLNYVGLAGFGIEIVSTEPLER